MGLINDKINERLAEALIEVEKHTAAMASGLAQFQNGNRLRAARPLDAGAHARRWGGTGRLVGWSVKATGGDVHILVRDGREAGAGDVIGVIDLVDTESETEWFGPGGVSFGEGLYLDNSGPGRLVGSVWIGAVD